MGRLTERDENGEAFIVLDGDSADWTVSVDPLYAHTIQCEAIDKLAELEDAEDQELLLRLPVPIGSTVYVLTPFCEICEEALDNEYACENCNKGKYVEETKFDYEMIPLVGEIVFLTREEAEAKLKQATEDIGHADQSGMMPAT